MANLLLSKKPPVYLYSLNVGSINAIKSIKEGNTHLAGIHIFDPETGEYNISFIQKNLKNIPIILVNLFHRNLGFIVKKGNPMNIKTFNDLSNNKKIKFINRNILSGTRTVLDYYIKKIGIEKESINGYTDEVYNHMALASAVASGSADAGIGILAAARSFKLDFIPVIPERFDIIVPKLFLGNKNIQNFLELLNTGEFKRDVEALGGYDLTYTGKIYYDS
jgi:putative molybdopterin biosynthesis protein